MAIASEQVAAAPLVGGGEITLHSHAGGGGGVAFTELAGGENKAVAVASTWGDWDLSAIVPIGTKSVLVAVGASTALYVTGARKKGSTLERTTPGVDFAAASLTGWAMTFLTECDVNRVIQIYCSNTGPKFNILGYWS